jgi:triosephosphate isomerase
MTKLIAGNWKMNGLRQDGVALASGIAAWATGRRGNVEIAVFPPATLIAAVAAELLGSPVAYGGQDCHEGKAGAHTGDVSAPMLADLGCRYVIVGHSERRQNHHETDAAVAAKATAAHDAGLVAIVCVGETGAERDSGQALGIVARQLDGSLPAGATAGNTIVAYEPVWAIGTGRVPAIDDVREMHASIRLRLEARISDGKKARILYGGSVKAENARSLLGIGNVDGALVGGASLDVAGFTAIAAAAC